MSTPFDTRGIGYQHYHEAFVSRAGPMDRRGRYTAGHLKGMTEAEGKAFSMKHWGAMDGAQRTGMIGKLATVFGLPAPAPQGGGQQQGTHLRPSASSSNAHPPPSPTGDYSGVTAAIEAFGSGGKAPSATPAPSVVLPRPGGNEPRLAAKLQGRETFDPKGPHVFDENGKPWTAPGKTPKPVNTLAKLEQGLNVLAGAKKIMDAKAPATTVPAKPVMEPAPAPAPAPAAPPPAPRTMVGAGNETKDASGRRPQKPVLATPASPPPVMSPSQASQEKASQVQRAIGDVAASAPGYQKLLKGVGEAGNKAVGAVVNSEVAAAKGLWNLNKRAFVTAKNLLSDTGVVGADAAKGFFIGDTEKATAAREKLSGLTLPEPPARLSAPDASIQRRLSPDPRQTSAPPKTADELIEQKKRELLTRS